MKGSSIVFLALCVWAAWASPVQDGFKKGKVADKQFLQRQKDILRLFKYVNQPSYYQDFVDTTTSYRLNENYENFVKPEVAKHFYKIYQYGLLPRGEIFSLFYQEHLEQAIALFKVFYYAKDWETFYKTAVWARNNINEGLFLYSVSVAIVYRPDTFGIVLPPIYEVYPYYFFSTEVLSKAAQYKQLYYGQKNENGGGDFYVIDANYSGYYLNLHPEQSVSYWLEDVGVNAFYYYYNIYYPCWIDGDEFGLKNDRRGEQYYYVYQQLLARYYLERLSNGFGNIEWFNWEIPFETGFYPSLRYPNGFEFPARPNFAKLHEYFYNYGQKWNFKGPYGYSYSFVQDYERRIRDAIDRGYVFTKDGTKIDLYSEDGFNILGNIVESNPDSPHQYYYGPIQVFARHLLGYSFQPLDKYKVAPSALEHFETSLRDPAFYQLYKRLLILFQKYKYHLGAYKESDLYFNGVEITKVDFDRLITYFDYFLSDLSYGVYVTKEEFENDKVQIRVRQPRLNHKPFTYRINVNSNKEQDAVVRIYLGPKYDEYGRYINITENRINFVQFDHFRYHLKEGANVIERNSHQNYYYRPDRTTYKDLYKKVLGALEGNGEFYLDGQEAYFGFPQRFLLPRGTYNGFEYQFYVIVSPYIPYKTQRQVDTSDYYYPRVGTGAQYIDGYPLGFPFDRPIKFEQFFYEAPNTYFYTTKIYHRQADDINASTSVRN